MFLNSRVIRHAAAYSSSLLLLLLLSIGLGIGAFAQTTIATGSITGLVTDPSGAAVEGATVTISNKATGQAIHVTSNSAGNYSSGALIPGDYVVRVEEKGFRTNELPVTVQVGVTSNGDSKLQVGQSNEVVEVQGASVAINTEQATVQGVLTANQIENLPVNGRNFLDLAQLEPGVQIQEGSTFDPTKNGFSSISFGGRFGRTARIEVDGVDISDETVGTTTQNIPASAIQEFQVGQSSLDVSTELTSSGSVNVVTKSGTNTIHGELFGSYRNSAVGAAALPGGSTSPWEREQFGGNLGGAIIKDKLFWFVDVERNRQDLNNPIELPGQFASASTNIGEPFRELETSSRLDYQLNSNVHLFYRFGYDQNNDTRPFGAGPSMQPFLNRTYTPSHTVGADFNTGSFTHSIRFEYLKFRNGIFDGSSEVTGAANPIPDVAINIGGGAIDQCESGSLFCSGPSLLAPQQTYQSDHQYKYDGSHVLGNHILRYGVSFNRILGGGFASFFKLAPTLNDFGTATVAGSPANDPNPLDYLAQSVFLGNGEGFATEIPQFGFPAGGQHDNRIGIYFGDNWKVRHNLNISYALRWDRDAGRTDSDLAPIPQLDAWGAGLGDSVRTPNKNFGPQLGINWDPTSSGKTSIRAGIGIYYENAIFNNVLFDRPARLQSGLFLSTPVACLFGNASSFGWPGDPGPVGTSIAGGAATVTTAAGGGAPAEVTANFCNQAVSAAAPQAVALEQALQAATTAAGPSTNLSFIGLPGADAGPNINGLGLLAPNYQTPRSVQMNFGVQHEIRPGLVFTADFLRNVATHTLLGVDVNHGGDVSTFNQANAIAARDSAQTSLGCPTGPGQVSCMIAAETAAGSTTPASDALQAYAGAGIGAPLNVTGGGPCSFCAFPGLNPNLGVNIMEFPNGRSVYNGLDVSLKQQMSKFFVPGVRQANFQISYSLSRFVSQVTDQDFVNTATDYINPDRFTGPSALDRTHIFSFGGFFTLPAAFQIGLIGHFDSPLAQSALLPQENGAAEILVSDVTGDGTTGDPVPGTQIGDFMRKFGVSGLQSVINNYNANDAGQPTPAGQKLISAGVFSLADLQALGGVMQPLADTAPGAVGLSWLKTFDMSLKWDHKIGERFEIEPSVSIFNIFNFANFDLPGDLQGGNLAFGPGTQPALTIGGTTADPASRTNRASLQSGVNALGAPRVIEWGMAFRF
jgi:hypothetical protein